MVKVTKDLTGQRFGRLVVISQTEDHIKPDGTHLSKWVCRCDCGNIVSVLGQNLTRKNKPTSSCGCFHADNQKIVWQQKLKKSPSPYKIINDTVHIQLNLGLEALADLDDLPKLKDYRWSVGKTTARQYPTTTINGKRVRMHWLIKGKYHDHIDGNPLNNTKANLRPYNDPSMNSVNRRKKANTTSKYLGVSKRSWGWEAHLMYKKKWITIGSFKTEEEAARARDKKAIEIYGEFAPLNFPDNN